MSGAYRAGTRGFGRAKCEKLRGEQAGMLQGRRGTLVGLGKSIPCTFPYLGIAVCVYMHLHFSFKGSVFSALFHCAWMVA